ncbi:class I SAM-dependent methyltransferase [Aneurinibacillus aneurinilyticus]|uniref:class I SAM-dependent methyltransferase n=1 Tax=Aneurinibacillus aneurinilyticus TaxID=1391 RepID=UPI0023F1BB54|nr:SAM-dependent methyltransferase [Aneurinibacillus aneurinilyticus]MED0669184.1 SAM-dependent methyltransferase [Aneurinibacillus aneurinilyticus]
MMNVTKAIQRAIQETAEGMISFRNYMEYALYSPEGGYYQQERPKIGKRGDFYTNASVGSVYGEILADTLWEMINKLPSTELAIVEMGGGNGQLSAQILRSLRETDRLATCTSSLTYVMIEASAYHRVLQEEALRPFRNSIDVQWYSSVDEAKAVWPELRGILLSNELLDAFPVHIVEYRDGSWYEVYVIENKEGGKPFTERLGPLSTGMLADYIKKQGIPPLEGYRAEINLDSIRWMESVAEWLVKGYVLTVDYGYERGVLYTPSRKKGTLLCYKEHTMNENPYEEPGTQDITTHVNFSALMDAAEGKELETIGFYTQQQFLMQAGILQKLEEHTGGDPFRNEAAKRNRAIRQLIMAEGMGSVFRVLVQVKHAEKKLASCTPWTLQR